MNRSKMQKSDILLDGSIVALHINAVLSSHREVRSLAWHSLKAQSEY